MSGNLNINKAEDWQKIRGAWVDNQLEKLQAHAERFFVTDDEIPLSRHILLSMITLFFVIFIVWASFAKIDETTHGEGKVIPSSEIQIIQNLEGGIVNKLLVREGDAVKAGQVIVQLRDVGAASDFGANSAKYLGLLATITRLQAEAEGKSTIEFPEEVVTGVPQSVTEELNAFKANQDKIYSQTNVLRQQRDQRAQEVRELETRARDLRGVIALSVQEKSMIEPLVARGSAPKLELLQLERGIKERQTELNGVLQGLPRAQSAVSEVDARIGEIESTAKAQAQTELSAKLVEMNTIKQTLGALQDRKDRTDVKSPVNGTVKDLKVNTVGGVVRPGDPIAEIVPMDDQLLVEAKIRPADIAFIHPDQNAMVKLTAYDFSIYGGLKGHVIDISADTITNEKGESFYRVKVRTEKSILERKGEVLPIIPGMVATVDILTGKKTIMQYLMKPFIKTLGRAMSER
ncbi:MAG: HlyD family type I secretion periplasmic adaptor subunit [Alphaproteobacteria bacterium]|nr:HlyD family type I secretion periplasmic adaptor subunit [Alphaproteobacteria bacterium]